MMLRLGLDPILKLLRKSMRTNRKKLKLLSIQSSSLPLKVNHRVVLRLDKELKKIMMPLPNFDKNYHSIIFLVFLNFCILTKVL